MNKQENTQIWYKEEQWIERTLHVCPGYMIYYADASRKRSDAAEEPVLCDVHKRVWCLHWWPEAALWRSATPKRRGPKGNPWHTRHTPLATCMPCTPCTLQGCLFEEDEVHGWWQQNEKALIPRRPHCNGLRKGSIDSDLCISTVYFTCCFRWNAKTRSSKYAQLGRGLGTSFHLISGTRPGDGGGVMLTVFLYSDVGAHCETDFQVTQCPYRARLCDSDVRIWSARVTGVHETCILTLMPFNFHLFLDMFLMDQGPFADVQVGLFTSWAAAYQLLFAPENLENLRAFACGTGSESSQAALAGSSGRPRRGTVADSHGRAKKSVGITSHGIPRIHSLWQSQSRWIALPLRGS